MDSPPIHPAKLAFNEFLTGLATVLDRVHASPSFQEKLVAASHRAFDPIVKDMSESRLPRIALVGRRGAGKSSLLNAMFEEYVAPVGAVKVGTITPTWNTLKSKDGQELLEVLDTRGVQEGEPPDEVRAITSLQSVLNAIREKTPDLFLFLVKAKEVNAAVQKDVEAMGECLQSCKITDGGREIYPGVIGIVSQSDELDPPHFWEPEAREFYSAFWDDSETPSGFPPGELPSIGNTGDRAQAIAAAVRHPDYDDRMEKLNGIRQVVADCRSLILGVPGATSGGRVRVISLSAYGDFRQDGTRNTELRNDQRWNIDELKKLIPAALPINPQNNRPLDSIIDQNNLLLKNDPFVQNGLGNWLRLPRIALIGRRGAGKSSLLNALFGQRVTEVVNIGVDALRWRTIKGSAGDDLAEILEIQALEDGLLESALSAIRQKAPDQIIFVVKAKDLNLNVAAQQDALGKCLKASKESDRGPVYYPPVIGIISQCDELDPPGLWLPEDRAFYSAFWEDKDAYRMLEAAHRAHTRDAGRRRMTMEQAAKHQDHIYHAEKLANIQLAVKDWRAYLKQVPGIDRPNGFKVIPVATWAAYSKDDGKLIVNPRTDLRWNVETLKDLMLPGLPIQAQMEFYRHARIRAKQHAYADTVVKAAGAVCGVIALEPVPFIDIGVLKLLMTLECLLIAYLSGLPLAWSSAAEFLDEIGVTKKNVWTTIREGVRGLVKLLPVGGSAISAVVATTTAGYAGQVAIRYFIDKEDIKAIGAAWRANHSLATQSS